VSQKDERAKAIDKVRKLRARAEGAGSSEVEVEKAMLEMGKLLDTFDITMDEVSLAAEECKKVVIEYHDGGTYKLGTVTVAVARFCDCVTYYHKKSNGYKRNPDGTIKRGPNRIDRWGNTRPGHQLKEKPTFQNHFFGIESEAETAAYLMELIREALRSSLNAYKKTQEYKTYPGSKLSLTKSFVEGFASRMVSRLNMMKHEREEELEKARMAREEMGESQNVTDAERAAHLRRQGKSTDLVALKAAKVEDDFHKQFGWKVKYRRGGGGGGSSWTGRTAGGNAAEKVNLSRPVGNGGNYSGTLRLGHG
jgi:hypothetical protein